MTAECFAKMEHLYNLLQGSGNIIEEEVRTMGPESLLCTGKESYARKALTMWSPEQVWMFNENAG